MRNWIDGFREAGERQYPTRENAEGVRHSESQKLPELHEEARLQSNLHWFKSGELQWYANYKAKAFLR